MGLDGKGTPSEPAPAEAGVRADRLASQVDESSWQRLSADYGTKGPRAYDWATMAIRPLREPGREYWLLARRSVSKPAELAYYLCFGPAETVLDELVRVAAAGGPSKNALRRPRGRACPCVGRGGAGPV